MIGVVAWTVYISSVNSYLKAQERQIKDLMNDNMYFLPLQNYKIYKNDAVREWFCDLLGEHPFDDDLEYTQKELEQISEASEADDFIKLSWCEKLSYTEKSFLAKEILSGAKQQIEGTTMNGSFDSLIYISASDKGRIRILLDLDPVDQQSYTGKYLDFDISEHPVIGELFENGSEDMVFEKAKEFPSEGNYYIGYSPVMKDGKVHSVFGIAYKWDDIQSSVVKTIIDAVIIMIAGMILLMLFIMLFLYRKAIDPVSNIQKALADYAGDKSAAHIVKKMYDIKADNELGYLADTISDLALEIDLHTKENIRIAVERERAEKELYQAKVSVMASQIQPHFMYNALTSIAMMCTIDPPTAQEATVTFAKYLRGNMDSLKLNKPVPFERKLEHLKKYLYIEKLRFADKLNIEYDIKATDFVLPMLSVQPLVENAVKHGVGMKKKGGTVKISTRETDTAFEVIISDDGVGFDPTAAKADDGRSHVGMENTHSRLKEMCGGKIDIESTVGEGTTATIILPIDTVMSSQI